MNVSSSRISSRNYWGNRSSDKGDLPDKTSLKSGYLGVRQRDSYTPSNQVADSNPYKIALNKHRYAQKSLNTGKTGDQALPDTLSNALKTELRTLVEDKTSFDRTLKTVFGPSYDSQRADQIAEMIRNDDFSWMPKIAMLPPNAMGEGKGAYDSKNNVVYLNSAISGRTEAATQVLMEEVGHFLDATLNKTDTVGDEGEHFRRIVSGETLSVADLRSIRADNDKGVIVVNGKKVEVEFFWGALKKAGKAIGGGFKKAGKAVGRGFKRAGKAIGRGFKRTGKAVGRGFKRAGKAIGNGFNAVGKSVVVGFKSVVGIGKKVFSGLKQAAFSGIRQMRKVVNTGLRWGGRVLSGIGQGIKNIPVIGDFLATVSKPAVAFGKRLASAGRGLLNGAISVAEGVARGAADTLSELGSGLSDLLKGDFKASWNHLKNAGISYIRLPWDGLLMTAATVISAVQTTTFLEPVGRRLRGKEIDMLKKAN